MTFGFIGELLGNTAQFLGFRVGQRAFVPPGCPMLELGETHPHLAHSTRAKNEDIVYLLNFVIDVLLIGGKTNDDLLSRLRKAIKTKDSKFEEMFERIYKKLTQKMKNSSSENDDKITQELFNESVEFKKSLRSVEVSNENITNLLIQLDKKTDIKKIVDESLKEQNKELKSELSKLKTQVRDLILEVKFDPDNPKPTEVRTEKNFRHILELSERVTPIVDEVTLLLKKVDKTLDRVISRIG